MTKEEKECKARASVAAKLLEHKNPEFTVLEAAMYIGIEEKTVRNKMAGKNRIISSHKKSDGSVAIYKADCDAYKKLKEKNRPADLLVVKRVA
jgi:hypothetical protein